MKKIILLALLLCTVPVQAQLVTEKYTSDHTAISTETTTETIKWLIYGNHTVSTVDDSLTVLKYDVFGTLISTQNLKILSTQSKENTSILQVSLGNGQWFNITFWDQSLKQVVAMVAYEYSDGYIIYHGNISY